MKGENVHHINGQRADNRADNFKGQRATEVIEYMRGYLELHGFTCLPPVARPQAPNGEDAIGFLQLSRL